MNSTLLLVAAIALLFATPADAQVVPVGEDLGIPPEILAEAKKLASDSDWWSARDALLKRARAGEDMDVLRGLSQAHATATGEVGKRSRLVGGEINALVRERQARQEAKKRAALAREALASARSAATDTARAVALDAVAGSLDELMRVLQDKPAQDRESPAPETSGAKRPVEKSRDVETEPARIRMADGKEAVVPLPKGADPDDYEAVLRDGQLVVKKKAKKAPEPKPEGEAGKKSGGKED